MCCKINKILPFSLNLTGHFPGDGSHEHDIIDVWNDFLWKHVTCHGVITYRLRVCTSFPYLAIALPHRTYKNKMARYAQNDSDIYNICSLNWKELKERNSSNFIEVKSSTAKSLLCFTRSHVQVALHCLK